jgi:UDP-2,3-diacylglucosamine hydrolase
MSQYTVITSDVHLKNTRSNRIYLFVQFLEWVAKTADALYIAGDLFDAFIGKDNKNPVNPMAIKALRQCTQSIPVYYTLGNHDCMVNKTFFKETGVKQLPTIAKIKVYGHSLMLTHGDVFCTQAHFFQFLRKFYTSKLCQKAFLMLPIAIRRLIVKLLMSRSPKTSRRPSVKHLTPNISAFIPAMQKHKTPQMIHGHTHNPVVQKLNLNIDGKSAEKISLGCWTEQKGCYLKYYPNGKHELLYFQ